MDGASTSVMYIHLEAPEVSPSEAHEVEKHLGPSPRAITTTSSEGSDDSATGEITLDHLVTSYEAACESNDLLTLGNVLMLASEAGFQWSDIIRGGATVPSSPEASHLMRSSQQSNHHQLSAAMPVASAFQVYPLEFLSLPQVARWIQDENLCVYIRRSVGNIASYYTNTVFCKHVMSRTDMEALWSSVGVPTTSIFMHPEDCANGSLFLSVMMGNLLPTGVHGELSASRRREMLRIRAKEHAEGTYSICEGIEQIVIQEVGNVFFSITCFRFLQHLAEFRPLSSVADSSSSAFAAPPLSQVSSTYPNEPSAKIPKHVESESAARSGGSYSTDDEAAAEETDGLFTFPWI